MSSVTVSTRMGGPEAWLSCSPDLLVGAYGRSVPTSPRCSSPLDIASRIGSCRSVSCSSSPKSNLPFFSSTLVNAVSSDMLLRASNIERPDNRFFLFDSKKVLLRKAENVLCRNLCSDSDSGSRENLLPSNNLIGTDMCTIRVNSEEYLAESDHPEDDLVFAEPEKAPCDQNSSKMNVLPNSLSLADRHDDESLNDNVCGCVCKDTSCCKREAISNECCSSATSSCVHDKNSPPVNDDNNNTSSPSKTASPTKRKEAPSERRKLDHAPVTCTVSGGSVGTESTLGISGTEGANSVSGGSSEKSSSNNGGDGGNSGGSKQGEVPQRSQAPPAYDPYSFEGRPITYPQAPSSTTNYSSSDSRRNTPPARNMGSPAEANRSRRRCLLFRCCCDIGNGGRNGSSGGFHNGDGDIQASLEEIRMWGESFDLLMKNNSGRRAFSEFLQCEYSEENILFWQACEDLKKEPNPNVVEEKARTIYEDYISILSPKEVSLDSRVREIVNQNMLSPNPRTFDEAQKQIYTLMHRDSYPRFINSSKYKELAQLSASPTAKKDSIVP